MERWNGVYNESMKEHMIDVDAPDTVRVMVPFRPTKNVFGKEIHGFDQENKLTKSGKHFVFSVFKCPFAVRYPDGTSALVPPEFTDGIDKTFSIWYFMPTDGDSSPLYNLRGYPVKYSLNYATPEQALAAAEYWEAINE